MTQKVNPLLFEKLNEEMKKKKKLEERAKVSNSGEKSKGEWVRNIVQVIKISELASERGIETCPKCNYGLQFDDDRGWFICTQAKYSSKVKCDFCGNIVDFTDFLMKEGEW